MHKCFYYAEGSIFANFLSVLAVALPPLSLMSPHVFPLISTEGHNEMYTQFALLLSFSQGSFIFLFVFFYFGVLFFQMVVLIVSAIPWSAGIVSSACSAIFGT